jgi:iron complex transport system ATP-binding protein
MVTGLVVESLGFGYKNVPVLHEVSLKVSPGQITALIGPNAAGKSTLLKCISGILRGRGLVSVQERDLAECSREEVIKLVAYLPQDVVPSAVLTVYEAILLARQTNSSWRVREVDLTAVLSVLRRLELEPLALRFLNELSGGQRQLVSIAQALARDPSVLLMDEPTSSLDLQHQLEVLELVQEITRERQITTLIAVHDLNLAARYAQQFIVLNNGTVYAAGNVAAVVTAEMLRDVYGVNAEVRLDASGIPWITPISSVRNRPSLAPVGSQ